MEKCYINRLYRCYAETLRKQAFDIAKLEIALALESKFESIISKMESLRQQ